MLKRYRTWKNRLTSEVVKLGGVPVRITSQRGKIVGVEIWFAQSGAPGHPDRYEHLMLKGEINA